VNAGMKSLSQITVDLESIYPGLATQTLTNEILANDVPKLKEHLTRIENKIKLLLSSTEKLAANLSEMNNHTRTFTQSFNNLISVEKNSNYKSSLHVERQDIGKQLEESNRFELKQKEILHEYFYRPLRHEYEDVEAMLELFKYRENIENKWTKAKAKVEKMERSKKIAFH